MLIFSPSTGLVQLVKDGQPIETGAVVLFESSEILKGLDSKPVTDVVIETVIQVLKRIPPKKITQEIKAEVTMSYGFSFDSNELNQTIETGELTNRTKLQKILLTKIGDLDISRKVHNCLKGVDLIYGFQILQCEPQEFFKFRGFGKGKLTELKSFVEKEFGISEQKWKKITEFFKLKKFDPEKTLCSKIEIISDSDSWKSFCDLVGSFENLNDLIAKDFVNFAQHDRGDKFGSHSIKNYCEENITDIEDQKRLTEYIFEIREIIIKFYQSEMESFVESLPLD